MRIFVISDTHFHHENIYKFVTLDDTTRVRPEFANATEGDKVMLERWNAVVTPQDHVYHLGDVTMGNNLSIVKHLNGHKRLLLGNHDKEDVRRYRDAGFQKVMSYRFFDGVILSHIPLHPSSLRNGAINVHGHIHENAPYGPQYRNVCVERINYTPILLEHVLKL